MALVSAEPAPSATDLTALVPACSPLLYRVAHSILRNPAEAEDVVQDVFLRVLEHQRKLPALSEANLATEELAFNKFFASPKPEPPTPAATSGDKE